MKKVRRFYEGGDTSYDEYRQAGGSFGKDTYSRAMAQARGEASGEDTKAAIDAAFKREAPARRAAPKKIVGTGSGRGGQGGPTADELDNYGLKREIDRAQARAQAQDVSSDMKSGRVEPIYPEEMMPPLRGVRAAAAATKAARASRSSPSAARPDLDTAFESAQKQKLPRLLMRKLDTYAKGGSVSSASKRADGIAQRGKTRGKYL
jgi:hypothetical protein